MTACSHVGVLPRPPMLSLAAAVLCCCAVLLPAAVAEVPAVPFTPPPLNNSYISDPGFDAKGLQPLYDAASQFMRGIQRKDPLPRNLLSVRNGELVITHVEPDWGQVTYYYGGVLAVVIIGILVALVMPVVALLWCCCSCCCCGGGGGEKTSRKRGRFSEPMERYHDLDTQQADRPPRPHVARPIALAVLASIAIAGAVIALVSNAYLDAGIEGLSGKLRDGVSDVNLFVDNGVTVRSSVAAYILVPRNTIQRGTVCEEVDTLMNVNYQELSGILLVNLTASRAATDRVVSTIRDALPLDTLAGIAAGLRDVSKDLSDVKSESDKIVTASDAIVSDVQDVRKSLQGKCVGACPAEVEAFLTVLNSAQRFTVEDVSASIAAVSGFADPSFEQNLEKGVKKLKEIEQEVTTRLDNVEDTIKKTIADTGVELRERSDDLRRLVQNATQVFRDADATIRKGDDWLTRINSYRYAGFAVFAVVLLAGGAAIATGLLFGCCSRRPSYGGLKPGLWLISLTITILLLLTTALFLVGLVGDRVCEAVHSPAYNQIVALVDELVKQRTDASSSPVSLHGVSYYITACREDKPLYEALDLGQQPELDIDQVWKYEKQFNEALSKYINDMGDSMEEISNVDLVPTDIESDLKNLATSAMATLDFSEFQKKIAEGSAALEKVTPSAWANELRKIGSATNIDVDKEATTLTGLEPQKASLTTSAAELGVLVDRLQKHSALGKDSFGDAVKSLLAEVEKAKNTVKLTAPRLKEVATDAKNEFSSNVHLFLGYLVDRVKTKALRCGPLGRIYDSVASGVCDHILEPWNGFWAGAGLSLVIFVPTSILAATLT